MGIPDRSNSNGTLIEQGNQSFEILVESSNESWVDIPVADCYSPRIESRKSSPRNSMRSPRVSQLTRKKRSSQNSSKDRKSAIFSSLDNALLNLDDGHNEKNHDNSSTGELYKSKEGSGALDPSKPKKNRIRSKSKKGTKTPVKSPEKSLEDMLRDLPDESNAEVFVDFGKGTELKDAISVPTTPKQRKRRTSKKGDVTPVRSKSLEARASAAEFFRLSPSPHSQKRKVPRGRKSGSSLHQMATMLRGAAIEDATSVYSEGSLPLDRDNGEEKGCQVKRRSSLLARSLQALEDLYEDCA
jgi:hypothetical protein